jgi:hypothetical protein
MTANPISGFFVIVEYLSKSDLNSRNERTALAPDAHPRRAILLSHELNAQKFSGTLRLRLLLDLVGSSITSLPIQTDELGKGRGNEKREQYHQRFLHQGSCIPTKHTKQL